MLRNVLLGLCCRRAALPSRSQSLALQRPKSSPTPHIQLSDGQLKPSNRADFLSSFIKDHPVPQRTVNYFNSIPWTKSILNLDTHEIIPFYSRYLDDTTGESRFFAQTTNTPTTIPHVLALRNRRLPREALSSLETSTADFLTLLHLGKDLESHPGIVNGGFQSVIFDEVMYCTLLLHAHVESDQPRPKHFTVTLKTDFLAPVRAGTDVLVRSSLISREGRAWFLTAEMVDQDGKVCIRAQSTWVTAKVKV